MSVFSKEVKQDKIILRGLIITFLFILLSLLFIFIKLRVIPPYIPLYNQLPWGTQRLTSSLMIFLPVLLTTVISFINIIILVLIYPKSQMISRMLIFASVLISILSFLFIIRTIQLIT